MFPGVATSDASVPNLPMRVCLELTDAGLMVGWGDIGNVRTPLQHWRAITDLLRYTKRVRRSAIPPCWRGPRDFSTFLIATALRLAGPMINQTAGTSDPGMNGTPPRQCTGSFGFATGLWVFIALPIHLGWINGCAPVGRVGAGAVHHQQPPFQRRLRPSP